MKLYIYSFTGMFYATIQSLFARYIVHVARIFQSKQSPQSPKSEDAGISVEDALNAFDFLETEDYIDGYSSSATG